MRNKRNAIAAAAVAAVLGVALCAPGAGMSAEESTTDRDSWNIGRAEVVDRVILAVIESYYDPARIDSLRMFKATLDALQKAVAELTVSYDDAAKKARIDIAGKTINVDTSALSSPWNLSRGLREVLRFLGRELPRKEYDLLDLEYLAANSMLSALDPHSNALPPDIYEDLQMDTAGEFGGLGIRITTDRRPPCNGNLTVVDAFDNTPAKRAGVQPGDQIVRIDGESTVNITTEEAAHRLRGVPGSKVDVEVRRADGSTRVFNLKRETITIESVKWEMLEGKVGYVSLEAFQGNSDTKFAKALTELASQQMKGLILDLRGNPGGLLDVAIKIADEFLDSGTIVTTAGRKEEDQSVRNATGPHAERAYPLVVLIDSSSASAAEIIAGALSNHGRALLVGETTFGKGSVQMVRPLPGGGALKLTSAQYLTPGDISIQAVGVQPDVAFRLVNVDRENLDLEPSGLRFSEADLAFHLDRPTTRQRDDRTDAAKATFLLPPEERRRDRARYERCYVDEPDRRPYGDRAELEFARKLVAGTAGETIDDLQLRARKMIEEENRTEERDIERALGKLAVDWTPAPAAQRPGAAPVEPDPKVTARAAIVGKPAPGKKVVLEATVRNGGEQTIYRLRAVTKSDNPWLDDYELAFGKIEPGRTRSWKAELPIPPTASPRLDVVSVEFKADAGPVPAPVSVEVAIPEAPAPKLAYAWQIEDRGNGNGAVEPGEELRMYLTVKNIGDGATVDAEVDLSAKPGVDIVVGRFPIGRLRPGETADGAFRLRVAKRFPAKQAKLHLAVEDWIPTDRLPVSRTLLDRDIDLPVDPPSPGPESASGFVAVAGNEPAPLLESPKATSRAVLVAAPEAAFAVDGAQSGWFRVVLDGGRHAWIAAAAVTPGKEAKPKVSPVLLESPTIAVNGPRVRRTSAATARVEGVVSHPLSIRDVMVFVGDRKVLYSGNEAAPSPGNKLPFSVDVPLEPGANQVMIVARHSDQIAAAMPVFIRRDP